MMSASFNSYRKVKRRFEAEHDAAVAAKVTAYPPVRSPEMTGAQWNLEYSRWEMAKNPVIPSFPEQNIGIPSPPNTPWPPLRPRN